MKKFFFLLTVAIAYSASAQTNTADIPVDGSVSSVIHVPGKGFVFHTQAEPVSLSAVTKANIVMMDEQMNLVWNIKTKAPLKNVSYNMLFTSANSSAVYWFFYEKGGINGKKISWQGTEEKLEIDGIEDQLKLKDLLTDAAFMDKDVLYSIQYTLLKGITTTTMYTVDFKNLRVSNVPLALPARPDYSYGWVYMGEGDGKIFFKSMDKPDGKANKIRTHLAVVDVSGKLLSATEFDFDFGAKFPFLVVSSQEYNGTYFPFSYGRGDDQRYKFSPVKLSPDKKFVYMYSLVQDEPGEVNKKRVGYIVAKYSIDGKKIWENIYPFKGAVLADKKITTHASNNSLNAYFDVNEAANTVDFHFWDQKEKTTYHAIVSAADGKQIDFFPTDNSSWSYSGSSYTTDGGHSKQIPCNHCVPPQAVPVTSKNFDQEMVTFISKEAELSFAKRVGKNYFFIDRNSKKGSIKAYLFEGK